MQHASNIATRAERFFEDVRRARERVLFLDFDGTIAPFHVDPARVRPYPGVAAIVRELRSRGTRVVIVSGRALADLQGPLDGLEADEIWASHGWQRHVAGGVAVEAEPGCQARARLAAAEQCMRVLRHAGTRLERKVASVAIHWRGLSRPAAAHVEARALEQWQALAGGELALLPFDGGLELRARGRDKGDAVREVLDACSSDVACAYLGDDLTDEDAFAAVEGRGLGVLVRPALRQTRARAWVRPPLGLLTFLHRWRAAASR